METTTTGRGLQSRQQDENTAFRTEKFREWSRINAERWTIPLEDRAAHAALDRRIDEFALERAHGWVDLFERHLREADETPDAVYDTGIIEAMEKGLAFQKSEVTKFERKLRTEHE